MGVAYDVSPVSDNRILSWVTFSSPSRSDSSDREICPSCDVGSRFNDIARCRSNKESLMWSARRKYWFGLAISETAEMEGRCFWEYLLIDGDSANSRIEHRTDTSVNLNSYGREYN